MKDANILKLLEANAYRVYQTALSGALGSGQDSLWKKISNPEVGDLVLETTTLWSANSDGKRLGRLMSIAREEYPISEDDRKQYLDRGESTPHEKVYYLELLDGREMRWTNASFIKVFETPWDPR